MNKLLVFAATAAIALSCSAASAANTDLGSVVAGAPVSFSGLAGVGGFTDYFKFSLPNNLGSGYSVSNFTLLPGVYNTLLSTLSLVSNPDGIIANADDFLLASSVVPGGQSVSLAYGASPAGNYYLYVTGIGNGTAGGIYTGAISVTAVPEPETYALMLAGLGIVGFLAARRHTRG